MQSLTFLLTQPITTIFRGTKLNCHVTHIEMKRKMRAVGNLVNR